MSKIKTDVQLIEKNGRTFSKRTEYYENGQIAKIGVYSNNQSDWTWSIPTGSVVSYHENGQVKSEESFDESGSREGESVFYEKDGFVVRRAQYQKDRLIKEEVFKKPETVRVK